MHALPQLKASEALLVTQLQGLDVQCLNQREPTSALFRLLAAKQRHAQAKDEGDVKAIDKCEQDVFDAQQQLDRLTEKREGVMRDLAAVRVEIEAVESLGPPTTPAG